MHFCMTDTHRFMEQLKIFCTLPMALKGKDFGVPISILFSRRADNLHCPDLNGAAGRRSAYNLLQAASLWCRSLFEEGLQWIQSLGLGLELQTYCSSQPGENPQVFACSLSSSYMLVHKLLFASDQDTWIEILSIAAGMFCVFYGAKFVIFVARAMHAHPKRMWLFWTLLKEGKDIEQTYRKCVSGLFNCLDGSKPCKSALDPLFLPLLLSLFLSTARHLFSLLARVLLFFLSYFLTIPILTCLTLCL